MLVLLRFVGQIHSYLPLWIYSVESIQQTYSGTYKSPLPNETLPQSSNPVLFIYLRRFTANCTELLWVTLMKSTSSYAVVVLQVIASLIYAPCNDL